MTSDRTQRRSTATKFTLPSRTRQSFKDECDINSIMERFNKTGLINHYNKYQAQYKETTPQTFTNAQFVIANAKSMFEELPAKARAHFHNNPTEFLEFANSIEPDDKVSQQTLIDLGLATAKPDEPSSSSSTSEAPAEHSEASEE